eukprot:scaffold4381_cov45-Phaeocystis_antarctica.AAC.4
MPQAPPTQHRDANGNANGNGDGLGVDRACLSHSPASFHLRRNSRPPPGLALPDYHHYQGAKRGRDLPVLEFDSRVGVKQTPSLPPAGSRQFSLIGRQLF